MASKTKTVLYTDQTDTNVLIGRIGLILQGKLRDSAMRELLFWASNNNWP